MGIPESNIVKDIKEIRLLAFNAITTMTELDKKLVQFEKNYSLDDVIVELWNKGLNRHQISQSLGVPYNTVRRHVELLIVRGKIQKRGRS